MKSSLVTIAAILLLIIGGLVLLLIPKEVEPTDTPPVTVVDPNADRIVVTSPSYTYGSNTPVPVTSPITITGRARGPWYFEASFPIELRDQNNTLLGIAVAQAQGEWMTEEFVPFSATLTPSSPIAPGTQAVLILKKDNPSGESQFDASLSIPVVF